MYMAKNWFLTSNLKLSWVLEQIFYILVATAIGYYLYLQPVEKVLIKSTHFTHLKAFLYLIYIISTHPTQVLWQVYKTPGLYIKIDVFLVHVYLNN